MTWGGERREEGGVRDSRQVEEDGEGRSSSGQASLVKLRTYRSPYCGCGSLSPCRHPLLSLPFPPPTSHLPPPPRTCCAGRAPGVRSSRYIHGFGGGDNTHCCHPLPLPTSLPHFLPSHLLCRPGTGCGVRDISTPRIGANSAWMRRHRRMSVSPGPSHMTSTGSWLRKWSRRTCR